MSKTLKDVACYSTNRINVDDITIETYVTTDNLLQNKKGKTNAEKLPKANGNVTQYLKGDILIANIRPYLKKIWFAKYNGGSSSDVLTFRVNDDNHSKFIYYALFRDDFFIHMMNGSKGTKMPRGDKNQILDFPLPNFNIATQKAIAKVLSDIDAKIELNNKINERLEAMAKTLYDYWFVQFDFPDQNGKPYKSSGGKMVYNEELKREIPEGWEVNTLGNYISFNRGISYTKKSISENDGIPMINLKSFNLNGTYRIDGLKYFEGNVSDNKIIKKEDLLIAITDVTRNADIIGKSILVPELNTRKIVTSCDIAKVEYNNSLTKNYLRFLFNSNHYHNYIKHFASGTLVLHLNLDGVLWYKDIIPPIELQNDFESLVSKFHKKKQIIRNQNQHLTQLRDWLLPMLMNGQVQVASTVQEDVLDMVAEPVARYGKEK